MKKNISIVTAVYNGEKTLQRLIDSISVQKEADIEFIIIDGGSSDNTVSIIKENKSVIDYWISEPDKGIYDAWNKGIVAASGDWIMFLGCDDVLMPNALKIYRQFLQQLQTNHLLVSSKVKMVDVNGNFIRIKGWPFEWPLFLKEMTIAHPGALHATELFRKYGMFNTDFKIVGDYELLLRPGSKLNAAYLNEVTVVMSEGGVSDSVAAIKEHYRAVIKNGHSTRLKAFANAVIVFLKLQSKRLARKVGLNFYLKGYSKN